MIVCLWWCALAELEPPCSGLSFARLIRRGKSGYTPESSKKPVKPGAKSLVSATAGAR